MLRFSNHLNSIKYSPNIPNYLASNYFVLKIFINPSNYVISPTLSQDILNYFPFLLYYF